MTSISRGHGGGILGVREEWRMLRQGMSEPHRDENSEVQWWLICLEAWRAWGDQSSKAGRGEPHLHCSAMKEGESVLSLILATLLAMSHKRVLPTLNPIIRRFPSVPYALPNRDTPDGKLHKYRCQAAECQDGKSTVWEPSRSQSQSFLHSPWDGRWGA